MTESADDVQAVAERLERLEDRRELEAGALGGGRPLVHDRAVRHVDEAEAGRGACAAVCASSVRAGIIESSSGNARLTPTPFRNVLRGKCFLVTNIVSSGTRDSGFGSTRLYDLRRRSQFVLTACTCVAFFIWNGALLTMPMTSADHL